MCASATRPACTRLADSSDRSAASSARRIFPQSRAPTRTGSRTTETRHFDTSVRLTVRNACRTVYGFRRRLRADLDRKETE